MNARIRKAIATKDGGFTLIELLVVMIIIGILAAIAIPVFSSQQDRAKDTALKSDLSTMGKEIAADFVDDGKVKIHYIGTAAKTTAIKVGGNDGSQIPFSKDAQDIKVRIKSSSEWCIQAKQAETETVISYNVGSTNSGIRDAACTGTTPAVTALPSSVTEYPLTAAN